MKLTFIGISAMTRPLLSSRFFRITTSPPTTMLITIPSICSGKKKLISFQYKKEIAKP